MQNESIPDARGPVFCGVDTHADVAHWQMDVLDWEGPQGHVPPVPADAAGEGARGRLAGGRGSRPAS